MLNQSISLFTCLKKAIFSSSFFLLTRAEKRYFSKLKAHISAWISKKKKELLLFWDIEKYEFALLLLYKYEIAQQLYQPWCDKLVPHLRVTLLREVPSVVMMEFLSLRLI